VDVYARPDGNEQIVGPLYEDQVVPWIREVVGTMPGRINQRRVETPYGYVWGGNLQPVRNLPNTPVNALPATSLGAGMWVEVSVPYLDLILDNPPSRAPWLQYRESIGLPARFVYSQVVWVDQLRTEADGRVWYRRGMQTCRRSSTDTFHAHSVNRFEFIKIAGDLSRTAHLPTGRKYPRYSISAPGQ
jgi:hypothetical protein